MSPAQSQGLIPLEEWFGRQQVDLADKLYIIVSDRHIMQGTRGSRGQRWSERVWTLLAACRQQNRRVFPFFSNAINAHFQRETAPFLLR